MSDRWDYLFPKHSCNVWGETQRSIGIPSLCSTWITLTKSTFVQCGYKSGYALELLAGITELYVYCDIVSIGIPSLCLHFDKVNFLFSVVINQDML
ncbi:hypothetical protein CEXT_333121 [Caerostris extrusa]|uniref:Uncharacterized protein n=1 Tax=Caerostris extrusa TaxID=172846 RepID=A0AAV4Y3Y5_CAEEX|nr:hypothetical protein CEXT_333121 [Caerostris extrusa]